MATKRMLAVLIPLFYLTLAITILPQNLFAGPDCTGNNDEQDIEFAEETSLFYYLSGEEPYHEQEVWADPRFGGGWELHLYVEGPGTIILNQNDIWLSNPEEFGLWVSPDEFPLYLTEDNSGLCEILVCPLITEVGYHSTSLYIQCDNLVLAEIWFVIHVEFNQYLNLAGSFPQTPVGCTYLVQVDHSDLSPSSVWLSDDLESSFTLATNNLLIFQPVSAGEKTATLHANYGSFHESIQITATAFMPELGFPELIHMLGQPPYSSWVVERALRHFHQGWQITIDDVWIEGGGDVFWLQATNPQLPCSLESEQFFVFAIGFLSQTTGLFEATCHITYNGFLTHSIPVEMACCSYHTPTCNISYLAEQNGDVVVHWDTSYIEKSLGKTGTKDPRLYAIHRNGALIDYTYGDEYGGEYTNFNVPAGTHQYRVSWSTAGNFSSPAYITIQPLPMPVVTLETAGSDIFLSWEHQPGAIWYAIYATDNPSDIWTLIGYVYAVYDYVIFPNQERKFYKLIGGRGSQLFGPVLPGYYR